MNSSTHFNVNSAPVNSVLKQSSSLKQRQRSFPLNVRIAETTTDQQDKSSHDNHTDLVPLSLPSENNDEHLKIIEINPNSTPDPLISKSTTPFTNDHHDNSFDDHHNRKSSYRLILNSSSQIYRTVVQPTNTNQSQEINQQLTDLTVSQLELLENYDPMVSAKIGVPFIPVQMLQRPRDAHLASKRSIQQIKKDYPTKRGQPVYENRSTHPSTNLIDRTQTLQLTQSKRIPIQRQTTFEKPENENLVEEAMHIKSFDNPNRLAISVYSSPTQRSMVKHLNSTRTSSKAQPSRFETNSISQISKDEDKIESNLSVLNLQTQQGRTSSIPNNFSRFLLFFISFFE